MNAKIISFTLSLLGLLIAVSWFTLQMVKENMEAKPLSYASPDSFAHNVTFTKIDKDGKEQMVFYTPRLVSYQQRDYIEFAKPNITIKKQNGKPWKITADKGNSNSSGNIINLLDNVKFQQIQSKPSKTVSVTTSSIKIYIDKKYAVTDKPIVIQQGAFTVNAVGANADLNAGIVNLLSMVREVYAP
jgi:LPS export ABC transporter protein LptC